LAEARAKAQSLAQAARDAAAADAEAKRKVLEDELAAKLAAAEGQINATRARAMANVGEIAQDAAGAIVERLAGQPADPAVVVAAVSQVAASGAA
jgi:F-type H+-transporting ATPase subunit b